MVNEWTVLVFLANDNNLTKFTKGKLKELESLGSTSTTNVIVQFDTLGKSLIRRFFVKDGKRERLPGLLNETNTGDKRVLIDFISRSRDEYPSRRSMLVISTHGSGLDSAHAGAHAVMAKADNTDDEMTLADGWFRKKSGKPVAAAAIRRQLSRRALRMKSPIFPAHALAVATDLTPGVEIPDDELDNLELKAVLQSSFFRNGGFDVLAFDSCLMNTFEVAYQLRGAVSFIVGSQSEIPAPGCKFTPILKKMQGAALETRELVKFIVDNAVVDIVNDDYAAASALDLSHVDELAGTISALADIMFIALSSDAGFRAIARSHFAAQLFMESETVDLFDFCAGLLKRTSDASIKAAAMNVQDAIGKFVVRANPKGAIVENSHGISIYFPKRDHVCALYSKLDFARNTSWPKFLDAYRLRLFPPPIAPAPIPVSAATPPAVVAAVAN